MSKKILVNHPLMIGYEKELYEIYYEAEKQRWTLHRIFKKLKEKIE